MTEKNFWIEKWEKKEIRFHQDSYHPQLVKFGKKFSKGNILVPLCGKSLDMIYLTSLGHKVIGVELSEIACREFFVENNIPVREKKTQQFVVFESDLITLYCGDFFLLPADIWKSITGIYDRAAIVALPEDIRKKYAAEIVRKTNNGTEILLISYEYPDGFLKGPPFSVVETEVRSLFQNNEIELLDNKKDVVRDVDVAEKAFWIRRS